MNKRFASQSALVMIFQYLKEKFVMSSTTIRSFVALDLPSEAQDF